MKSVKGVSVTCLWRLWSLDQTSFVWHEHAFIDPNAESVLQPDLSSSWSIAEANTITLFFILINCIYFIVLLQSLDYDNIENQLFLEEERRMSYMVNRVGMTWVYVLPSECFAVLEFVCFLHVILYLLGFPLSGDQSLGRLRSNRLPDRPHRLFYRHRCGRNCWDQIPSGQREYPEDLCIVHIDIDIEIYIVHICILYLYFTIFCYFIFLQHYISCSLFKNINI